jgi:hypothetical protein
MLIYFQEEIQYSVHASMVILRTAMKFHVLASVFLNVFQVVYMRIELEDFYPYGPENGDTSAPINDDGSTDRINIGFPFPFFDQEHESLFVSPYNSICLVL